MFSLGFAEVCLQFAAGAMRLISGQFEYALTNSSMLSSLVYLATIIPDCCAVQTPSAPAPASTRRHCARMPWVVVVVVVVVVANISDIVIVVAVRRNRGGGGRRRRRGCCQG